MEDIAQIKKILKKELMDIITERVNNPGMNPDFDGIFFRVMKNKYISRANFDPMPEWHEQTKREKREYAIGKFTNYAFYKLMGGELMPYAPDYMRRVNNMDSNQFDNVLKEKINEEAYGIRMGLEENLKNLRKNYGHVLSVGELGDTSEKDWYTAQEVVAGKIMLHYGTVSM